jgi:mannitol/fructose-specific phosphotransferase system IIA component (Ntr-type)
MADRNVFYCTPSDEDRFCVVIERCALLDLEAPMELPGLLEVAIGRLSPMTDLPPARLLEAFHSREAEGSTVVKAGIAIPHVILPGVEHAAMLLARCRGGVNFPGEKTPVHAILMLVEGLEHRYFHLQALAALSRSSHDPRFMENWLAADSIETLRRALLETHRSRCTMHRSACL